MAYAKKYSETLVENSQNSQKNLSKAVTIQ